MKTRKSTCLLSCAVFLLLLQGCGSIKPAAPNLAVVKPPEPEESQIEVPFDISLEDVFALVENEVPKSKEAGPYHEWFGTNGADDCGKGVSCAYKVARSPLGFSARENSVTTSFSLSYWAECKARSPICGPLVYGSCGTNREPERTANGSITTSFQVNPTWNITANTKNNGIEATNRCQVTFLYFDVTDKIEGAFNGIFDRVAPMVDTKINEKLILKPLVEKLWNQLSSPIKLEEDVWITIRPQRLNLTQLNLSEKRLKFSVGLLSKPAIEAGNQPVPEIIPLPDATFVPIGNTFVLNVPVSATQAYIENMLKEKLQINDGGTRYPPIGKKYIKITNLNLYGYGSQLVIKISFEGSAKGWAYLTGTPSFNTVSNTLTFPDLQYTVDTKNIIVKAIDWINHDNFIADLRNKLTINLSAEVTTAKQKIDDALNKQYGDVKLSGDVNNLAILGVITDSEKGKFTAYFNMSGHLNASVK